MAKDAVALETTLLVHGVPRESAGPLNAELGAIVRERGSSPALIGVVAGVPTIGMTDGELAVLLAADRVEKVNTANLGLAMYRGVHAATTVSATCELAAGAGLRVFATGGIGGVHREYGTQLDISADLAALARFPVAVVSSGVKGLLDVRATREALETLGVPVVGYRTDAFPAFYQRGSDAGVDARFDDAAELAGFVAAELARTGRGVLVCNPIPSDDEIPAHEFEGWLREAAASAGAGVGRDATPAVLGALHRVSRGRTLRANLALVRSNAGLAAELAAAMGRA